MKIKNYVKKIQKYITDKDYRLLFNAGRGKYDKLPDKEYLEKIFKACMGYALNLENPQTFNEKLQWLKLYNRNPAYTVMVDKYKVRDYIKETIGEEYLIPLLGVWDRADDIDFDALPNQFVLKCNHNSGLGMYICKDKSKLTQKEIKVIRKNLTKGLQQDYYLTGREWPYKNVPRKIIAEKYMQNDAGGLTDYKVHCFNGKPEIILVCKDRFTESGLTEDFFSVDWKHCDIRRPAHPNNASEIEIPAKLEEMLNIARRFSERTPFLRVDFYNIGNEVYFSELTFFPASGFEKFIPTEWDYTFGSWLDFSNRTINA